LHAIDALTGRSIAIDHQGIGLAFDAMGYRIVDVAH
jgi:hypothetical protein